MCSSDTAYGLDLDGGCAWEDHEHHTPIARPNLDGSVKKMDKCDIFCRGCGGKSATKRLHPAGMEPPAALWDARICFGNRQVGLEVSALERGNAAGISLAALVPKEGCQ